MRSNISVAITGTSGLIGKKLLAEFAKDSEIRRIIAIDTVKPEVKDNKIRFVKVNLRESSSVDTVGNILIKEHCETAVHCALPGEPPPDADSAHELIVTGTMHALLAAELADVQKIILSSTTEVYGALPDNPNFLTEEDPLRGSTHSRFLRDKIDAERQFTRFQKRFPKKIVVIFRPCTIIAPEDADSGPFAGPTIPTVMGFDPLIQFVHIDDVIRAFVVAIKGNFKGAYNMVGSGTLPLSRALKIAGKLNLPMASDIMYAAAHSLWHLNIRSAPAGHIDLLKYSFTADGAKARKVMGFKPAYSCREALLSLGHPSLRGTDSLSLRGAKRRGNPVQPSECTGSPRRPSGSSR